MNPAGDVVLPSHGRNVRILTKWDVLSERGNASQQHPGNERYWRLIVQYRMMYLVARGTREGGGSNNKNNVKGKKEIAKEVAEHGRRYGGSFLKRDMSVGMEDDECYEMNEEEILEKIMLALRSKKNLPEIVRDYARSQYPDVYNLFLQANMMPMEEDNNLQGFEEGWTEKDEDLGFEEEGGWEEEEYHGFIQFFLVDP